MIDATALFEKANKKKDRGAEKRYFKCFTRF